MPSPMRAALGDAVKNSNPNVIAITAAGRRFKRAPRTNEEAEEGLELAEAVLVEEEEGERVEDCDEHARPQRDGAVREQVEGDRRANHFLQAVDGGRRPRTCMSLPTMAISTITQSSQRGARG